MEDIPQSESTVKNKKKKAIGISSWLSSLQSRKHLRKESDRRDWKGGVKALRSAVVTSVKKSATNWPHFNEMYRPVS